MLASPPAHSNTLAIIARNFPTLPIMSWQHNVVSRHRQSFTRLLLAAAKAAPSFPPWRRGAVIIDGWFLIGYRGGRISASHTMSIAGESKILN